MLELVMVVVIIVAAVLAVIRFILRRGYGDYIDALFVLVC